MKRKNDRGLFDFGIYEVFYDDNGKITGWTENPLTPTCASEENLKEALKIMQDAFQKETLTYKSKW